ncbi:MAG TPA: peptide ABC transporter substrate-binding protein, partial [Sphaerochaeta sp.]|nr:peptide ABC transporter substrate-binding protein [Sphaerochaeta sp.]
MKKFLVITLSILLIGALFISCGKKEAPAAAAPAAAPAAAAPAPATPKPAAPAAAAPAAPAAPAPAPAKPAAPADEIVFKITNGAEPESLDPALVQGVPEHRIYMAIFEGLVAMDPKTGNAIPGVAESWTSNEDGT